MADRQSRSNWQVHESTARALCRMVFVTLGLLPLGLCVVWSAQVFLPVFQRQQAGRWEQLLSAQLGAQLKIAAVEALAPQRFALHEIRLLHPETNVEIGRVRRADIERQGGKWLVTLTAAELEGAGLATTCKSFHDWFLCRPRHAAHATRVGMNALTILEASGPRILQDVSLDLLPGSESTVLTVQFRHVVSQSSLSAANDTRPPKLSQLIVKRHHLQAGLKTTMELCTGSSQLACSLLVPLSPVVSYFGERATFAGTIEFNTSDDAWRMRMTNGRLNGVDMAKLTAGSEAAISGQADLFFEELSADQQGLETARGGGVIVAGNMTQGVFRAVGKHLGVALRNTNRVSLYGFDQCEFFFDLREPRLQLCCLMSDAMSDELGPLAARSQQHWDEPLPLENIIAALQSCMAETDENGPARLPATWLAKQALMWLPLGDEQVQAAKAHLRLSSNDAREIQ